MRSLKTIFALILFVLVMATFVFSDDSQVRVTASKANIRLRPTTQSTIVSTVPLGAVLEVIKKEGNWYFVKLPPDKKGIVVTGYIHQSLVEIFEEIEKPVKSGERIIEKKEAVIPRETPQKVIPKPTKSLDLSKDAEYLRWKEAYYKAEADFKKWKKYAYIGMFAFLGGIIVTPLTALTARGEGALAPMIGAMAVGIGGAGLWLYAANRRGAAAEKMALLMNEGRIKKYISAYINPKKRCYAVTFAIAF